MIVEHSLKFVTEFKEGHPVTIQMQQMPEALRVEMLEGLLKELVAPAIMPVLEEINKGGSYAILKVAN